tara:strand:+ start:255 stop:407 length:153 start_codon:yes stop_codon:yes gene_type:complete
LSPKGLIRFRILSAMASSSGVRGRFASDAAKKDMYENPCRLLYLIIDWGI